MPRSTTSSAALVVRERADADFDALVELDLASARHHVALDPDFYRLPDRNAVSAFLARRLSEPGSHVLVAVVDGEVVGRVDFAISDPPDAGSIIRPIRTADLGIAVADGWRGKGIGHTLMAAAEARARELGAEQVVLDMSAANDGALRFYERLGYRQHGRLLRRRL